ncbi:MAG: Trk family potassium uptake protein [Chloroflexi bacterium]|nr:Trk family potassium uptake protein [Chloroflexota bacterium]MBT7079950.1 Trk family potassium uptake protein [Chloroflexota bacterium]MBT7290242.1 Trk family potassium uptake protein [Chloroflexota bacterium]
MPGVQKRYVRRDRSWRTTLPRLIRPKPGGLSITTLIYGFLAIIAIGTLLLSLSVSNVTGEFISPIDALFTSTSSVCVTGLVVVDTGTFWTPFGQAVILVLIQVGGFGFMTSTTLLFLVFGWKIGLRERMLIGESIGLDRIGGIVGLIKKIAIFTIVIETVGAVIFCIRFSQSMPFGTALWRAVFHSVSAFNNAGFDIFGNFRSMIDFQSDALVVLVTAALVIIGGISFVVYRNIYIVRRFKRLALDTKIVIVTTLSLLFVGTVVMLLTESFNDATLGTLPTSQKILNAFFMSVTPRTAGFTTVQIGDMADYALFFTMVLMFIGGASGSTAGGIKVNTFGMLTATLFSSLRWKAQVGAFGREFPARLVHKAMTLVMLALGYIVIVVLILTMTEDITFLQAFFETVSAFGTVGLSTGITPELSTAGRLVITVTMFVGRMGPLTLALSLMKHNHTIKYRYPQESVRIG